MSAAITVAPARASARVSAAPCPCAAPVTMTILPATPAMSGRFFRWRTPDWVAAVPANRRGVHGCVVALLVGRELDQLDHSGQGTQRVYVDDSGPGGKPVREGHRVTLPDVLAHVSIEVRGRDPPVVEAVPGGLDALQEDRWGGVMLLDQLDHRVARERPGQREPGVARLAAADPPPRTAQPPRR